MNIHLLGESNVQAIFSLFSYRDVPILVRVVKQKF